jgi:PncC family amidohydrolase
MGAESGPAAAEGLSARIVTALRAGGDTLAVAESLTGGLVTARVVDVPGASTVLRGGVVAYATDLKHALLGVDADLLAERGAVDPDVALAMARGVAGRLGSTWAVATTGVAGPDPQDGQALPLGASPTRKSSALGSDFRPSPSPSMKPMSIRWRSITPPMAARIEGM